MPVSCGTLSLAVRNLSRRAATSPSLQMLPARRNQAVCDDMDRTLPCSTLTSSQTLFFSPCKKTATRGEILSPVLCSTAVIDISKVTDYLYVGSRVGREHADELKVLNFNLIISMIGQMPPDEVYNLPPFKTLWIKTYDSFVTPISIKKFLIGVKAALPVIQSKGKVLVFCMEGKRRSVAMAAAVLISMGHSGEEAIDLLTTARTVADPRRWYIRRQIKAFEHYWQKKGL